MSARAKYLVEKARQQVRTKNYEEQHEKGPNIEAVESPCDVTSCPSWFEDALMPNSESQSSVTPSEYVSETNFSNYSPSSCATDGPVVKGGRNVCLERSGRELIRKALFKLTPCIEETAAGSVKRKVCNNDPETGADFPRAGQSSLNTVVPTSCIDMPGNKRQKVGRNVPSNAESGNEEKIIQMSSLESVTDSSQTFEAGHNTSSTGIVSPACLFQTSTPGNDGHAVSFSLENSSAGATLKTDYSGIGADSIPADEETAGPSISVELILIDPPTTQAGPSAYGITENLPVPKLPDPTSTAELDEEAESILNLVPTTKATIIADNADDSGFCASPGRLDMDTADMGECLLRIPAEEVGGFLDGPLGSPEADAHDSDMDAAVVSEFGTPPRRPKRVDQQRQQKSRKMKTNPENWKSTAHKTAVQSGAEHLTKTGKVIPAKTLKPGCGTSCRFKCSTRVTEEHRREIFAAYWKTSEQFGKWSWHSRHVKVFPPKAKDRKEGSRRKNSRMYFFKIRGEEVKVCKTMYCSTLDISDGSIQTTVDRLGSTGNLSPDKRGKNKKRRVRKIAEIVKNSVRKHIEAIPQVDSHYVRSTTTRRYLDPTLNVKKMYGLYLEWVREQQEFTSLEKPATERQYRDIFNYEFNLSFVHPRKDQCDDCTTYKNSSEEEKIRLSEASHDAHLKRKQRARELKANDAEAAKRKNNKSLCVATFDFQKILNCPKGESSCLYYRRKFQVSNLSFYDVGLHEAICYCYDETVAKKGGNEVGSLLADYVERKAAQGVTDIIFYSDNCTPQNKNRFVLAALLRAAVRFNVRITHRFLEKGHTQNEGDSVHARIERYTRNDEIYVPSQWYQKIREAKRSKNPYKVIEVEQNLIFNYDQLATKLNFAKDSNGDTFRTSELRETFFDYEKPGILQFKLDYDEEFRVLCTKKKGHPVNLATHRLTPAYNGPLPVAPDRLDDLLFLCEKRTIPQEYHNFYASLVPEPSRADQR